MEKEFVPYEQALALKELGFDEPCFGYYVDGELRGINLGIKELGGKEPYYQRFGFHVISNLDIDNDTKVIIAAPTYSQAFRWFREKYNLEITTNIIVSKSFSTLPINKTYSFVVVKTDEVSTERINKSVGMRMDIATPEELNIQALDKLIEIAKKINIGLRI